LDIYMISALDAFFGDITDDKPTSRY
jgi:hypothetical protein